MNIDHWEKGLGFPDLLGFFKCGTTWSAGYDGRIMLKVIYCARGHNSFLIWLAYCCTSGIFCMVDELKFLEIWYAVSSLEHLGVTGSFFLLLFPFLFLLILLLLCLIIYSSSYCYCYFFSCVCRFVAFLSHYLFLNYSL